MYELLLPPNVWDLGEISPELEMVPNLPISSLIMTLSAGAAFDAAGDETIELRADSNGTLWSMEFMEFSQLRLRMEDGSWPEK